MLISDLMRDALARSYAVSEKDRAENLNDCRPAAQ